jgi:hypothetical protein
MYFPSRNVYKCIYKTKNIKTESEQILNLRQLLECELSDKLVKNYGKSEICHFTIVSFLIIFNYGQSRICLFKISSPEDNLFYYHTMWIIKSFYMQILFQMLSECQVKKIFSYKQFIVTYQVNA